MKTLDVKPWSRNTVPYVKDGPAEVLKNVRILYILILPEVESKAKFGRGRNYIGLGCVVVWWEGI